MPDRAKVLPHDALVKAAFASPRHAASLYRHMLTPNSAALIDWASLRLESGSHVDPRLSATHSDLLFSGRLCSGTPVLLYLLLEHQSRSERFMALRMSSYVHRVLERHRKDKPREALPVVLPFLLSNAPDGWTAPTRLQDLFSPHPETIPAFAPYTPHLSLMLMDLAKLGDPELERGPLPPSHVLVVWALRDGRVIQQMVQALPRWVSMINQALMSDEGMQIFGHIIQYLSMTNDETDFDTFCDTVQSLIPQTGDIMITKAEVLMNRGRAEGIEEGRAQILIKMLQLKFGQVPAERLESIHAGTDTQIEQFIQRIFVATSLDEVFIDPSSPPASPLLTPSVPAAKPPELRS